MNLEEAAAMGRALLSSHGLEDWSFTFDRAKRRAGMCRFDQRTISLSRHLTQLHDADQVRDTLLHEIAHAIAGPKAGHGSHWRAVATQIGARPQRLLPDEAPLPPAPWQGSCPGGHEHRRFRRPTQPLSCSRCCPRFCLAHLIVWSRDGQPFEPGPDYRRALSRWSRQHGADATCPRCGLGPSPVLH